MTALRPSSTSRRQGQPLRGGMRQALATTLLLAATAYLSFKLGTHSQLRRSIREAAAAAPPPPRCAEQLANATAALTPGWPQKPDQVRNIVASHTSNSAHTVATFSTLHTLAYGSCMGTCGLDAMAVWLGHHWRACT
jgi:hypothetical protein